MTKNHFNGKKSIFQVFLGYAVTNSKNFPDQDHTVANLLRSGIKYFRDVLRFSSYLTRYTHTHTHIYIYIYIYILAVPDPALLGFDYFPIYYILIIAIPDS